MLPYMTYFMNKPNFGFGIGISNILKTITVSIKISKHANGLKVFNVHKEIRAFKNIDC